MQKLGIDKLKFGIRNGIKNEMRIINDRLRKIITWIVGIEGEMNEDCWMLLGLYRKGTRSLHAPIDVRKLK